MRHVCLQFANCLIESLGRLRRFRRKKLERKCGRISPHDVRDMHDLKAIFVRAASFGQLTKHLFDQMRPLWALDRDWRAA